MNAVDIWDKTCGLLRERLSEETYSRYIAVITPQQLNEHTLTLSVINDLYQIWLEDNYLKLITETVARVLGRDVNIRLEVHAEAMPVPGIPAMPEPLPISTPEAASKRTNTVSSYSPSLNPKYVFSSFVVGPSNSFAHAASLAVAQAPGKAYNPLFIHGGVGLGKTHLMQAIGNFSVAAAKTKVQYVTCETLMNEYIDSLHNQRVKKFRDKYRSVDLLLIDDIHFLANKLGLQEEFFHTFNVLYDSHKQIVMTSDRPASDINGLEQRLVSRFEWGLVTDLMPPDFETRVAILRFKQKTMNVIIPEEVLVFIASNIESNIRSLEGALTKLASYSSLIDQKPMSIELAKTLLQNTFEKERREPVTVDSIQKCVAAYFDIRLSDMTSKHRSQGVAMPRQVAMYLCRRLTALSFPEIGHAFEKTHATVMHACNQMDLRISKDDQLQQMVNSISKQLGVTPGSSK